jgi:hypothetical protein
LGKKVERKGSGLNIKKKAKAVPSRRGHVTFTAMFMYPSTKVHPDQIIYNSACCRYITIEMKKTSSLVKGYSF